MNTDDVMFSTDDDLYGSSDAHTTARPRPTSPAGVAIPPDEDYDDDGDGSSSSTSPTTLLPPRKTKPRIPTSVCSLPCKTGEIMIMNTVRNLLLPF